MEKLQVITITIQKIRWETLCIQIILRYTTINCRGSGKIANPFTVFFMGHKGIIEAKYTTNKRVLPEALINEMREAFKRSEEFLDLEVKEEDPLLKQREQVKVAIEKATPEKVQELLKILGICNT